MHEILMEQLVADRRRSLEASAAIVRTQRSQRRRGTRRWPLTLWRSGLRRAPAPAVADLAALGEPRLRHLTVVAERVSRAAAAAIDKETPGAAA